MDSTYRKLFIVIAFIFAIFMATYRITETPPTWMDEGAIEQVSMNLADKGVYGYQLAPETFTSAGFLTTSYPVIYPVAAVFKIFGASLLGGRLVMALFIIILCMTAFIFIRNQAGEATGLIPSATLALLVTFAPLYGHGKNILGEVPGLAFFLVFLILFFMVEKGNKNKWLIFAVGIFAGLSAATKPIFLILAVPSVLIALLVFGRKRFALKEKAILLLGLAVPLVAWLAVHFSGDPILAVFSGNPDGAPITSLIGENFRRFITEFQPMYFLGLMAVWWAALIIRKVQGIKVNMAEYVSVIFSTLNFLSFFATLGYYRYFFPGEVIALIFFPSSLYFIFRWLKDKLPAISSRLTWVVVGIFIIFQLHQTLFRSWVSEYGDNHRSALLSEQLGRLPEEKTVLFYNVPEAVIFLPHSNYFQYFRFADAFVRGEENIHLMEQGIPDYVLVDQKIDVGKILRQYREIERFDKYVLFEKRDS